MRAKQIPEGFRSGSTTSSRPRQKGLIQIGFRTTRVLQAAARDVGTESVKKSPRILSPQNTRRSGLLIESHLEQSANVRSWVSGQVGS